MDYNIVKLRVWIDKSDLEWDTVLLTANGKKFRNQGNENEIDSLLIKKYKPNHAQHHCLQNHARHHYLETFLLKKYPKEKVDYHVKMHGLDCLLYDLSLDSNALPYLEKL